MVKLFVLLFSTLEVRVLSKLSPPSVGNAVLTESTRLKHLSSRVVTKKNWFYLARKGGNKRDTVPLQVVGARGKVRDARSESCTVVHSCTRQYARRLGHVRGR